MTDAPQAFRDRIQAVLGPLAGLPEVIEPGRICRFSTNGKRSDTSGWLKLFEDQRAGLFGCFRQGVSEVWTAETKDRMTRAERAALRQRIALDQQQRERQQQAEWRRNGDRIKFLMRECRPVIAGDPVHRYLCRRLAVSVFDVPNCIGFHPAMPYVHDGEPFGTLPAMVAPLTDRAGRVLALHRTYLTPEGAKAGVPGPVKKLTPAAGLLRGACIRLFEPNDMGVGIAEGIETAMAARLASGMPVVASYSAGNLAAWAWPRAVRRIVVFGDHDDAGTRAAEELKARAVAAGVRCDVVLPSVDGDDWCDVWSARADATEVPA